MAFDERLANRVRDAFARNSIPTEEKRMMGGLCFMVNEKMCVGIAGSQLMVRIDPTIYEESLKQPGCVPMDFTGRPMRGFVFVNPEGTTADHALVSWIELAVDYNPRARSSKSKGKSTSTSHSTTTHRKKRNLKRSAP